MGRLLGGPELALKDVGLFILRVSPWKIGHLTTPFSPGKYAFSLKLLLTHPFYNSDLLLLAHIDGGMMTTGLRRAG